MLRTEAAECRHSVVDGGEEDQLREALGCPRCALGAAAKVGEECLGHIVTVGPRLHVEGSQLVRGERGEHGGEGTPAGELERAQAREMGEREVLPDRPLEQDNPKGKMRELLPVRVDGNEVPRQGDPEMAQIMELFAVLMFAPIPLAPAIIRRDSRQYRHLQLPMPGHEVDEGCEIPEVFNAFKTREQLDDVDEPRAYPVGQRMIQRPVIIPKLPRVLVSLRKLQNFDDSRDAVPLDEGPEQQPEGTLVLAEGVAAAPFFPQLEMAWAMCHVWLVIASRLAFAHHQLRVLLDRSRESGRTAAGGGDPV